MTAPDGARCRRGCDTETPDEEGSPIDEIEYPLSGQERIIGNSERLRAIAPAVSDAFMGLRGAVDDYSTLSGRERELILLAGFTAARNQGGFRVHCHRATAAGVKLAELEQLVMLMLGTNLGIAPTVETLTWLHDELR
jgi:alkylhydroperoxidase/carboxymuconolactone decarboxylase family protein YurZ